MLPLLLLLAGIFPLLCVAAVDPIVIKGSKFFYKTNGTQFFIKGVAYQPTFKAGAPGGNSGLYIDPLADPASCARDIPLLKKLGTNTLRIYTIDPTLDHTVCMRLLQDNGIYIFADLSQPRVSITVDTPTWDDTLYSRYISVVDAIQNYTNVIGFFAGNEVPNSPSNTGAAVFVRAAVRDVKAYIKQKGYRNIGVGFSMNDDDRIRYPLADFFNCGSQNDAIDFLGYNVYSWCGAASYSSSGYQARTERFANYSVPLFFSEYGCNVPAPRIFTEVQALFSAPMTGVWSGGIVYEWFQNENKFGLVQSTGTTVSLLPDYTVYSSQIAKASPTGVSAAAYTPTNVPQSCPPIVSAWQALATPLPPTPNVATCACMVKSLTCVVRSGADQTKFGTIFGSVCGAGGNICSDFAANPAAGTYGKYSMCNAVEKLSWAFNQYYKAQGSNPGACDWSGTGTIQTPTNC